MSRDPRPGDFAQVARSVVEEATRERDEDADDQNEAEDAEAESDDD